MILKIDCDTYFLNTLLTLYVVTMYRQFNIQQFHVLCGSQNKPRLFPYTAFTGWFL